MKNGPYELVIAPPGYPGKRYRNKYAYEHQVVYWQNTGKQIPAGFVVHHKNHKKRDNRFENLELICAKEHSKHHGLMQSKLETRNCGQCGAPITKRESYFRFRLKLNKFKLVFCSISCGSKFTNPKRIPWGGPK